MTPPSIRGSSGSDSVASTRSMDARSRAREPRSDVSRELRKSLWPYMAM